MRYTDRLGLSEDGETTGPGIPAPPTDILWPGTTTNTEFIRTTIMGINAIGRAIEEMCKDDDDDINCDEWVKNLNMAYAQISVFKRAGGNTRLAELQHNKSVNILCNDPDCGHLCSKVNRF